MRFPPFSSSIIIIIILSLAFVFRLSCPAFCLVFFWLLGGADLQLAKSALGPGARLKREEDTPSGRRERSESIPAIQGSDSEKSKARHQLSFSFLSSSTSFFQGHTQTCARFRSAEQSSDLLAASHLAIAALDVIQATKAEHSHRRLTIFPPGRQQISSSS